ncbi:MAG: wax ester/triacylglycerol synthase family O-acyltransferase [bacterium]|nr:wax ester/triacylglycerol synthase family O-acyltransferase [bacterium]MCP5044029.1 wax ester/triacylglycerol synthase family O-acyltransferase [bacterium]
MQQLSGMDAAFLYFENKNAPTHITSLAIYDQSSAPGGRVTFKGILANMQARLHLARCFRQKVVRFPFDLDHPYWVEDPEFDIEFHVRHIALPHPGDWRQLCIQAARIHSRPLDLSKPLWEMYVVEGLDKVDGVPKGSFAVMTKIHHSAIDGVSGAEMMAAMHDLEPDAKPEPPTEKWVPERDPSVIELGLRSAAQNIRDPFRIAKVMGRTIPPIAKLMWGDPEEEVENSGPVPRTRFNGTVTAHRVIEGRVFSLQDVRDIRKRVPGATVNDVILTVCAGALRRYLEDKNELPTDSLVAMAPISVRREGESGTAGNRISSMSVTLYTNIADPVERLERVHEGTRGSKAVAEAMGADTMTDITQVLPGTFSGLAARMYMRLGLANRVKPFLNTVVTNVPGPQVPLYFTGARIVALFGLGPVMDGMGIIHPVFSFSGRISIAVTACRDQLPDPSFYADCLQESFDELLEAATKSVGNEDE